MQSLTSNIRDVETGVKHFKDPFAQPQQVKVLRDVDRSLGRARWLARSSHEFYHNNLTPKILVLIPAELYMLLTVWLNMKHTHFFRIRPWKSLLYRWSNPLTSASHYLLDITDKSSFDKAMSYIKELTETNPVSLLDPLWSTTPTTTAIFQFLQVVL